MNRLFLVLVATAVVISAASGLKEWKNFENGKVYSHITPNEKKEMHGAHKVPATQERLLHSHHRDKKVRANSLQTTETKPPRGKNPERHHRKSAEEEMGLRPLNERHHKFPNPALLDKTSSGSQPQIATKDLAQQNKHAKVNNRRRQHGRRLKRNRGEQRGLTSVNGHAKIRTGNRFDKATNDASTQSTVEKTDFKDANPPVNEQIHYTKDGYPLKISSYW